MIFITISSHLDHTSYQDRTILCSLGIGKFTVESKELISVLLCFARLATLTKWLISIQHVLAVNSDWIRISVVTCSYSSHPFLCALAQQMTVLLLLN